MRLASLILILIQLSPALSAQEQKPDAARIRTETKASPDIQRLLRDSVFQKYYLDHDLQQKGFQDQQLQHIDESFQKDQRTIVSELVMAPAVIVDQSETNTTAAAIAQGDENEAMLQPLHPFFSVFELSDLKLETEAHQQVVKNSLSVMAMVSNERLIRTNGGYSATAIRNLCNTYGLCPDEPYCNQPVLPFGTAFLISNDMVLTASHNLKNLPLKTIRFVIGYKMLPGAATPGLSFREDQVFFARKILRSEILSRYDLALVQLNRPVTSVFLSTEGSFDAAPDTEVYMLGYPLGLPLKFSTNGRIRSVDNTNSFYVSLDAYQGNSGSPVFDAKTHQLIGVLVSGGIDFQSNGNCNVSKLYAEENYTGDRAISVNVFRSELRRLVGR